MVKKTITQQEVLDVLNYNKDTGVFVWKKQLSPRALVGQVAGCFDSGNGYLKIAIFKRQYSCHRLAWLCIYGEFPSGMLDHIDRDKTNNAIKNLRKTTHSQNNGNKTKLKRNTSGWKGVFKSTETTWRARICPNSGKVDLGSFKQKEDAAMAYNEAALIHYGEFALLNDSPLNHIPLEDWK